MFSILLEIYILQIAITSNTHNTCLSITYVILMSECREEVFGGEMDSHHYFSNMNTLKLKGFLSEVLNSHTYDILEMGHSSFVEGKAITRPSLE